jgi:broad specificity phosphatase PhoE
MGRWYLVRHGQTEWNLTGRAQGRADIPLNDTGRLQAERLAARLTGTAFAAAYTSDRARAVETAVKVLQLQQAPLHKAPELREAAYGQWEGLVYREAEAQDPALFARYMAGDVAAVPPGGESIGDHLARVGAFTASLVERHPRDDLLLVAHAGSLRGVVIHLLGLPAGSFWRLRLDQASLSVVTVYPGGAALDLWNDTCHLEGPS